MTEPKLIVIKESGELYILTQCPKCKAAVKIPEPTRYLYFNIDESAALLAIHCKTCGWHIADLHASCARRITDQLWSVLQK